MNRDVGHGRPRAPRPCSRASLLFAAVALSAAAHAAVVLLIDSRGPIEPPAVASASMPLRLRVGPASPSVASPPSTPAVVPLRRPSASTPTTRTVAAAPRRADGSDVAVTSASTDDPLDRGPKPLTYPVIPLPPDDDPRRVGLVRLMLVVSSEGRVVKSVVTAATLSQDYVDRITESFEALRFDPATAHGLPRASWYEVVVDFTFDPGAASAV